MDPVLAIATVMPDITSQAVSSIGRFASKWLSAPEAIKLREQLAFAIAQVGVPDGGGVRRALEVRKQKKVVAQLPKDFNEHPLAGLQLTARGDGPGASNVRDWRADLVDSLAKAAGAGTRANKDEWNTIMKGSEPRAWAQAVANTLESQMWRDPDLRLLVARLDTGNDQAGLVALVAQVTDMTQSLRALAIKAATIAGLLATALDLTDKFVH